MTRKEDMNFKNICLYETELAASARVISSDIR